MTTKEIQNFSKRVSAFIETRRLRDAIRELKAQATKSMAWEVGDRIDRTEQNYAYMLKYVADGAIDPERDSVYRDIISELYSELDSMVFFLNRLENTSQYYSTVRLLERTPKPDRIASLIKACAELVSKLSIFSLVASGDSAAQAKTDRKTLEQWQSDLFVAVWTSPHLSSGDLQAIDEAISGDALPAPFKTHLLSAVTLGLLERYDPRRMEALMKAYMTQTDVKVSSVALVGMLLGLWRYSQRPLPKRVSDMLAAVKERDSWKSDLRIALLEMIRARDTERINRKIRDEVLPDMMNLRPEIMKKINDGEIDTTDFASLQENPEWKDLMDRNGITDKLKELTEMQMEGGDVMMSTFEHLKAFPFFRDISNWFLPFDPQHTQVADTAQRMGMVSEMIDGSVFLCDSDKYSFMFAIDMVPADQRQMMTSQFQAQSDGIYEAMGDAQNAVAPEQRRRAVNQYMQNIYRFFKLFRRKDEFFDPFAGGLNLVAVPSLAADFDDLDLLQVVAEFYFKLGYMADALDVFMRLEAIVPGDAARYQKMGYCCEKLRRYPQAIEYYQRAELLDSRNVWTVKRLAACYRAVGDKDKALDYYRMLAERLPDDMNVALLYGYALMESDLLQDALQQFYKVEFLDEKSSRSWRPLAWTLFLNGDFKTSMKYYEKLAADHPTHTDYLNMGHVALGQGNSREAINDYTLSIQTGDNDREAFLAALEEDKEALHRAGVNPDLIPLIADAVFYALDK